jgi:hypothetical protein
MVGNTVKGIYGNLAGTLNMNWSIDTRVGAKMMIAIACASVMCG